MALLRKENYNLRHPTVSSHFYLSSNVEVPGRHSPNSARKKNWLYAITVKFSIINFWEISKFDKVHPVKAIQFHSKFSSKDFCDIGKVALLNFDWQNVPKHQTYSHFIYLQGGEDPQDAFSCRSFFAQEPLIIGLFCGKWRVKIRHPMTLRHSVMQLCADFW